jgi:hypothetical protein
MSLRTTLETVQQAVRDIPCLNQGGCGIFALAVTKQLAKRGIAYRIRVGESWMANIFGGFNKNGIQEVNQKPINSLPEANAVGVFFQHIYPEVKVGRSWMAFDSNYLLKSKEYQAKTGLLAYEDFLEENKLETLAMNPVGWNERFDRDNIPTVFDKVEQAFA